MYFLIGIDIVFAVLLMLTSEGLPESEEASGRHEAKFTAWFCFQVFHAR